MAVSAAASTGQLLFVGLTLGLDAGRNVYMRDEKSYTVQQVLNNHSQRLKLLLYESLTLNICYVLNR